MLKAITECRVCGGSITQFLDLGRQYLSDFRDDDSKPPKYPLVAVKCDVCHLVQLKHSTPQNEMYHQNYGFKSGINEKIIIDLDDIVTHAYQYVNDPRSWLDIASNDGTLLSFIPKDVYRVGVDPVKFLCEEAEQHANWIINDYFTASVLEKVFRSESSIGLVKPIPFDVITSISCFYDMPDPSQFVQDVKDCLAPKGVWIIQQNYLLTTLELNAIDNFCHEHLEYYTLVSLENLLDRFDLEVNEVLTSTINGGSIRTIVSHKGTFPVDDSVYEQRSIEKDYELNTMEPYKTFANRCMDSINQLRRLVLDLKIEGKTIALIAASTRGATIWQAADLGPNEIRCAVERNPAKVGRWFSSVGVPIISEEEFSKSPTDYAIIGPWFFGRQIAGREADYVTNGGSLIMPLPEVKIINRRNIVDYIDGA